MRATADLTTEDTESAERKSANRSACATTRRGIYGPDRAVPNVAVRREGRRYNSRSVIVRTWEAAGCAPTKQAAPLEDSPCATGLLAVGFGI